MSPEQRDLIVEGLIFIHPSAYEIEGKNEKCPIRGYKTFDFKIKEQCQSEIIFGYECPLEDITSTNDHIWPYSLGGPTIAVNRITLCKTHNSMKSNNFHFQLESQFGKTILKWLPSFLEKIHHHICTGKRNCIQYKLGAKQ